MSHIAPIAACLALLVTAGLVERFLMSRARATLTIRIHVNGTRGKSTVTRLIWAVLNEAGIPALARCTGTAARLICPDGTESAWKRRGRANIIEVLRLLWLAHTKGARALVAECMAVQPELQWIAEHRMLRSTLGVITNVRTDHTEVMGKSLEQVAASLANTVPVRAALVLGENRYAHIFERRARALSTQIFVVPPWPPVETAADSGPAMPSWLIEDRSIALAVARAIGIADQVALAGMDRHYHADPGSAGEGQMRCGGRDLPFLVATAANDPESLERIVLNWRFPSEQGARAKWVFVYNHRSDRPERIVHFVKSKCIGMASTLWVTGARPAYFLWRRLLRLRAGNPARYISAADLGRRLGQLDDDCLGIIFCGNTHGLTLSDLPGARFHG